MIASSPQRALRVVVASEQWLVSDAVRAALASRGFRATALRWPGDVATPAPRMPGGMARRLPRPPGYDCGLLVTDLDRWGQLRAAAIVMSTVDARWIELTGDPRGPLWGAANELGARLVLPNHATLDQVAWALTAIAHGESLLDPEEARELVGSWTRLRVRREELQARVESLTPRQHDVLRLLYDGVTTNEIADLFDVSPATVRSQVKAVLRKLGVNSQLAAVAAFGVLMEVGRAEAAAREPATAPGGTRPVG